MELEEAVALYKSVGPRNADFLFGWLNNIYSRVYLPCIDLKLKENLADTKTKLAIFDVLVDDIADNYKMRDENLLKQFMQIPWNGTKKSKSHNEYLDAGRKIWESCVETVEKYPRFRDFERIFYFDLQQVLFSMEYNFLVNTKSIDNDIEDRIYLPHGTMVVLHCDMDLMCSPNFDLNDLGNMRAVFHLAQRVAHLGNLINTYPREIIEKDFSSPILSLAVRKGIITRNSLSEDDLPKIKELEREIHSDADGCIERVKEYENKIRSVNITGFSDKLRDLFALFVNREQYWKKKE